MDEQGKTKSSYLGIIIFLVIFAGLAFGITYKLAKNNLSSNQSSSSTSKPNDFNNFASGDENNDINNLGIKNYTDYYYTNNLQIIPKRFVSGELIKEPYLEYYPLEINYIEIDGLKNKKIEDKINKEIKEIAFDLSKDELKDYQKQRIVRYNINANFANILSIKLENHSYNERCLNYDLTTGNQIKFEEIFTDNANIKEIVQNSLYDVLNNPYEPYDEQAFELMYRFLKNDFSFAIYSDYISMDFDDTWHNNIIYLNKNYKDIAIFNRFMTSESIFENEDVEKVEYGFTPNEKFYYVKDNVLIYLVDDEGKYSKNFENYAFKNKNYSIPTDKSKLSKDEVKTNNIIDKVQNKILNVMNYSINTPDTMQVLGIEIDSYYIYTFKLECEKNKFYDNIKRSLIDELKNISFIRMYDIYNEDDYDITSKFDICSLSECSVSESGDFEYYEDTLTNSSKEIIKETDIQYYDYAEFYNIAYNEIFARHGHDFKNKDLKAQFDANIWYLPTYGKVVSLEELNDIEKQNANFLKNKAEIIKKYPDGMFKLNENDYTIDLGYNYYKYKFSYSDDENKIGGIYTPSQKFLTYNEFLADTSNSSTKNFFKGKYLHIIKSDTEEIYQTIEVKDPFENVKYNPDSETLDLGSEWNKYNYRDKDLDGSFKTPYSPSQRVLTKYKNVKDNVWVDNIGSSNVRVSLKNNGNCYKIVNIENAKKLLPNFEYNYNKGAVYLGADYQKYQFSYSDKQHKLGEIYYPASEELVYNHYENSNNKTKSTFKGKYLYIMEKGNTENYRMIEIFNPFSDIGVTEAKDIYLGGNYKIYEFAYSDDGINFSEFNRASNINIEKTSNIKNKDKSCFYTGKYVKIRLYSNEDCFIIIDIKNPEVKPKEIDLDLGDILQTAEIHGGANDLSEINRLEPGEKRIDLEFDRKIKNIILAVKGSDGSKNNIKDMGWNKKTGKHGFGSVSEIYIETNYLKSGITYTLYIESLVDEFDNKISDFSYTLIIE